MSYDAALVARRGLGADELRLIDPGFAAAVRWAFFAEKVGADLPALRADVTRDPPEGMTGQALVDFQTTRNQVRSTVAELDALLYPPGDEDD